MMTLVLGYVAARDGGLAIVTPPAEIDLNTAAQFENELNVALLRGIAGLIVDMGDTTFCDSAGTAVLARAYSRARDMNTTMCLVAGKSSVRKIFEINGIDQILKIYDSLADAQDASTA
jgi:anti-sigma B factor antagonist